MKPRKKIYLFGGLAAGVLLLLTLLMLTLTGRKSFLIPEITPEDWMRQSRLSMHVMQKVFQCRPGETAEQKLTEGDVNTLLHFAANGSRLIGVLRGTQTRRDTFWICSCRKDVFHLEYLARYGILKSILSADFRLDYRENHFTVIPLQCKLGHLPIPAACCRMIVTRLLAEPKIQERMETFHRAVEAIEYRQDKKSFYVRYYPASLRDVFRGSFSL